MKGFTLIELLVVVLIIGILSAVALPQYTKAVNKARMTNILTLLRSIKDAEERHYLANGAYTLDWDALDISMPASCTLKNNTATCKINGWSVSFSLSAMNFDYPNFYMVVANSTNVVRVQWQLDQSSILPGKRICFPSESSSQALDMCKGVGGTPCGAYSGWYPGMTKGYCLPD